MNLDTKTLFDSALMMFIPVLAGVAAAKLGYFGQTFSKTVSSLVLNVAQPFMIIASMVGTEYSAENLRSGFTAMLVALLAHAVAAGIALLTTFRIREDKERRITEFCMIFSNCGFFGFPLLRAVYGSTGVFWGGFYLIVFQFVIWTYGVLILGRANPAFRIRMKEVFLNNGTIPCVIGFLLYLLRVPIYPPVFESMDRIGATCTPLSMLVIGNMIAGIPPKKLLTGPLNYLASAVRLVLIPLAVGLLLDLLGFSREMAVFGALMMSLPAAAAAAMFAEAYDIRPEQAAQTVGVSTLLSVATIPLVMRLLEAILNILP